MNEVTRYQLKSWAVIPFLALCAWGMHTTNSVGVFWGYILFVIVLTIYAGIMMGRWGRAIERSKKK